MEDDHEFRFVCKLCNKKYPCGKSLGGHMRSHVVSSSAEMSSLEKADSAMKRISPISGFVGGHHPHPHSATINDSRTGEFGNGQTSYGLRENPRKSWRAVGSNFPSPQERICKQCGKGFQSLKALCGHMACHSDRDKGLKDDQYSWTSENNQKLVIDSHSDTDEAEAEAEAEAEVEVEAEDRILRSSLKNKRCKKIVNNNNGSSSVSEIDGEENEEVAMCLMMLSRDSGNNNKGGVNSVVESSDNNSVILETKSSSIDIKKIHNNNNNNQENEMKKIDEVHNDSDSGYFLDECAKYESDASVDGFRRNIPSYFEYDKKPSMKTRGGDESSRKRRYIPENIAEEYTEKRSKYECFNCKKTFKSYQALGGHRPCHKRSTAFYETRYESGENSLEGSTEFIANNNSLSNRKSIEKKMKGKKNKPHVCPFCDRVFKNGQALGGHKRSHFIGGHVENNNNNYNNNNNNNRSTVVKTDMLDLNLPAPVDDEDDEPDEYPPPR